MKPIEALEVLEKKLVDERREFVERTIALPITAPDMARIVALNAALEAVKASIEDEAGRGESASEVSSHIA